MSPASRLFRILILGAVTGAIILGVGGRLVMRFLALIIGQPGSFSIGGSLEIMAYGALVGLGGGLINFFSDHLSEGKFGGIFVGLMTYGLAFATLPDHIAETAAPFTDRMWLVHVAFGAVFLSFGIILSMVSDSSAFAKRTYRH